MEIARGLLFPGLLSRKESLTRAGHRAAQLLLGAIPLLVVAAVIEASISPVEIAVSLKFSFAAWPHRAGYICPEHSRNNQNH